MDLTQTVVLAASFFVIIYLFIAQPNMIRGASMEENYYNGDYILTEKISYRLHNPKRGDVIVFQAPNRPDTDYIKRIIALPGEKIELKNGKVYVNDQLLSENYQPSDIQTLAGSFLKENQTYIVPQNSYFVLGDNRSHSSDSREFGTIQKEVIVGKAFWRYWPLPRFGLLKSPIYEN